MKGRLGLAAVAATMAATQAAAHHSISAAVDVSRDLDATAVLTRIDWINPHAWFHFDFRMPGGKVVRDVRVESMSINGMRQAGYAGPDAFKIGAAYTVTYHPNRDGSPGGFLVRLAGADGRVYEMRRRAAKILADNE
jgi:hypothetical protein